MTQYIAKTTPDLERQQIERLKQLFPKCVSEGKINWNRLRATLGDANALAGEDSYSFTWAGKQEAFRAIQTPSAASLAPAPGGSVNWETVQHLFIEGENLEALKLLYESYDSGAERDFALGLEGMDEVKLFVKLPDWFVVPTPIGDYNPDWAVVFQVQDAFGEKRDKLYLVRDQGQRRRRGTAGDREHEDRLRPPAFPVHRGGLWRGDERGGVSRKGVEGAQGVRGGR